jgi:hypothetical protein
VNGLAAILDVTASPANDYPIAYEIAVIFQNMVDTKLAVGEDKYVIACQIRRRGYRPTDNDEVRVLCQI